jgi:hypothetical protein
MAKAETRMAMAKAATRMNGHWGEMI